MHKAYVFGGAAALIVLSIGGYLYVTSQRGLEPAPEGVVLSVDDEKPKGREVPPGFKEYLSVPYRFSILYPEALQVQEYEEGQGAATIILQNEATAEGFQIFIVPYLDQEISEERFRSDVPTGVRLNPREAAVAGVRAVAFESENMTLGETYEVWFIREGYLYEVTTLRPLNSWLDQILSSWQFL